MNARHFTQPAKPAMGWACAWACAVTTVGATPLERLLSMDRLPPGEPGA